MLHLTWRKHALAFTLPVLVVSCDGESYLVDEIADD